MTTQLFSRIGDAVESAYELERELGVGGTSVVYLARDRKHERKVALKVLLPDLAATIGSDRFLREIKLAARLTHPHILPLLDSGDAGGLPYYVMPYIEGESLRTRLDRVHRLDTRGAILLTREISDALDYAHAAGIIHRDIKPENILTLGNHCVVADFGIARAVKEARGDDALTSIGLVVGTPAYMSPEQASGEPEIDGRTDLYSLAVMLFEMLTGRPPFIGATAQQVIAKRFMETPPRLSALYSEIPEHISDAVAVALSADPHARQASVLEFARALAGHEHSSSSLPAARVGVRPVAVPVDAQRPSIAVIPFENLGGDSENEYFSDGLTEEIITTLSRQRKLRVAARTSSFAFKNQHADAQTMGKRLGVDNLLQGTVRRGGERLRVNAELLDAHTGHQLWSEAFDRKLADVFAMQDDIAHAISETLKITLLGDSRRSFSAGITENSSAHDEYLKGRYHWNKRTEESLLRAGEHFREAARLDPDYALAYAAIADTFVLLGIYGGMTPGDAMPLARSSAEKAVAIDPTLAEAHTTLAAVRATYDWNWSGSESAFRRAIALSPNYPTSSQWYALHYLIPQRRFSEAKQYIERAAALDPLSLIMRASVGVARYFAGDYAGAIAEQRKVLANDTSFAISHFFNGITLRDSGDYELSIASFERAMALAGRTPEMLAGLAQSHAKMGSADLARTQLDELVVLGNYRYVAPSLIAQIQLSLNQIDDALASLERAVEVHDADLIYVGIRPAYRVLEGNPRYTAILKRLGLPGSTER